MSMSTNLPDWFETALENTRRNYRRIDISTRQCPYCDCAIHVATGWIGKPEQKEAMSFKDFRPEVYPFCASAQGTESQRLFDLANRTDDWRPSMAAWYHQHIAQPESEQHRKNMVQGYPTWQLAKYTIDPNQDEDFR